MKKGLVVGKFWPLHKGHQALIEYALDHCDQLTVLVVASPRYSIPHGIRYRWIEHLYPRADVWVIDDINDDDNSVAWAKHTIDFLGFVPDVVFTSEDYGDSYAAAMNCRHDRFAIRNKDGISGTKIRNDPYGHWDDMDPSVRAFLTARVTIVGPESTGKTTLAKRLATELKTVWTPEFGRLYSEGLYTLPNHDNVWTTGDFLNIAVGQNDLEAAYLSRANKVIVNDTDAFATGIWHQRYMGSRAREVDALDSGKTDLYLLTAPDVEFVQDGIRDGEHLREWMFELFKDRLKEENYRYIILDGSYENRYQIALQAIQGILNGI